MAFWQTLNIIKCRELRYIFHQGNLSFKIELNCCAHACSTRTVFMLEKTYFCFSNNDGGSCSVCDDFGASFCLSIAL